MEEKNSKRKNKYTYMNVVQGYYGMQYGWEDVCQSEDRKEARGWLRDYRVNGTDYPHRLIRRRVLNEAQS